MDEQDRKEEEMAREEEDYTRREVGEISLNIPDAIQCPSTARPKLTKT